MAHTKAQRAVKGNRDSRSKRLGVKIYGGQAVNAGNIIIRQKGTRYDAGMGTKFGSDYTIYAVSEGRVAFKTKRGKLTVDVV